MRNLNRLFGYPFSQLIVFVDLMTLCLVHAQLATLTGTNYASGSGFCFGDQQLKEGPTFISCTHSGFTGTVTFLTAIWSFDGGSTFLSEASVDGMFPGRIDAVNMEPVEGRLNILNVTNLGVSSVACRITAMDNSSTLLGQTPLSAAASISVVNTVPGPGVSQGTVSNTTIDVVLMRPNGLCEGLSDNPITYMIEVFSDNILITTRNVTSTGATTNYTISNLTMGTLYRVSVQAVMNVVSRSNTSEIRIATLGDIDECNSTNTNNCSHYCNDTIGGYFCSCPNDYILSSNNVTCEKEDVNECETKPPPCSQICRNTVGSFICSCFSGYTIAEDGFTCNREQGPVDYTAAIAGGVVGGIVLVVIICVVILIIVVCVKSRSNSVKDNDKMLMSAMKKEERANLGEDTYASPGTEKPQPETTDGVYSYAATETKIGAQMKEREQQKKQLPPQGDFYEEPNAAKNMQHKAGTITGETYAQPDKPKRGTKKKDKQQKEPVPHKEAPAGELYAMPDKKKDVSHTSGPVTGDEYAVASKPKTGGGYGAHGPQ